MLIWALLFLMDNDGPGSTPVVPPIDPDPVDPSGGTDARRRRFAGVSRGGR